MRATILHLSRSRHMQDSRHYRSQARVAQRLGDEIGNAEASALLLKLAQDYRDIAEDLENGAAEIRHSERMPQRSHSR